MTRLFKLTRTDYTTHNNTLWDEGVSHKASGTGPLCGPGWLHAYEDATLGMMMNPIHADFNPFLIWEAEGEVGIRDGQFKCGVKKLTTLRIIDLPRPTPINRVAFGILCSKQTHPNITWNKWADSWLSGKNRGLRAAYNAAKSAAESVERSAESAAESAAWSAWNAAESVTEIAAWAAESAARSMEWNVAWGMGLSAKKEIDFVALAKQAMLIV